MTLIRFSQACRQEIIKFDPSWIANDGLMTNVPEPEDGTMYCGYLIWNGSLDFPERPAEWSTGFQEFMNLIALRSGLNTRHNDEPLRFMITPGTTYYESYIRRISQSVRVLVKITPDFYSVQAMDRNGTLIDSPLGSIEQGHLWLNVDEPRHRWVDSRIALAERLPQIEGYAPANGSYLTHMLARFIRRAAAQAFSVAHDMPFDQDERNDPKWNKLLRERSVYVDEVMNDELNTRMHGVGRSKRERKEEASTEAERIFFHHFRTEVKLPTPENPFDMSLDVVKAVLQDQIRRFKEISPYRERQGRHFDMKLSMKSESN